MDSDREPNWGQVPLPGFGESTRAGEQPERAAPTRAEGVRHVRRMSNWTAAALIVGTGATTVARSTTRFLPRRRRRARYPARPEPDRPGPRTARAARRSLMRSRAPQPSGVVVTTTTHTANGKVIVSHVRHSTYRDN